MAAHSVERPGWRQASADIPRHLRNGRRPGGLGGLLSFQNGKWGDFSDIKMVKQQAMSNWGCDIICIYLHLFVMRNVYW